MAWISPWRTLRLTSDRASTPGNSLVIDRISRSGGALSMVPPSDADKRWYRPLVIQFGSDRPPPHSRLDNDPVAIASGAGHEPFGSGRSPTRFRTVNPID